MIGRGPCRGSRGRGRRAVRPRQDDRRHRADRRPWPTGAGRVAPFKVGPGLHRPRLPRAGRRAPRPQPGPLPGRRRADRAAVRARRGRRRHRRGRGRHGPVRRRRRRGRAGLDRAGRQAAARARSCWSWTPPRRAARSPRWCTASARFDPGVRLGGVVLNRVGSDRHARVLHRGAGRAGHPGARRGPARRRGRHALPAPGPGPGRRAARRGGRRGEGAWASWSRRASTWTRSCAWPGPPRTLEAAPWDPAVRGRARGAGPAGPAGSPWPRARPSPSPTPRTPSCSRPPAGRAGALRPAAGRGAAGRVAGLVIGGGFPEVYAQQLSDNARLRADGRAVRRARRPSSPPSAPGCCTWPGRWTAPPMCGVLDAEAAMSRAPDPGLPARRRRRRLGAGRRRDPGRRARVPPHRAVPGAGLAAGLALAARRGAGHRGLRRRADPRLLPASALGRGAGDGARRRRLPLPPGRAGCERRGDHGP